MIPALLASRDLGEVADKLDSGGRLDFEDGVKIFRTRDLTTAGFLANQVRERLHGKRVYFANYLNINPTNVCAIGCLFCSFARWPGEEGGYALSLAEIRDRVRSACENQLIREVHIVGGLNDALPLDYYFDVVSTVKETKSDLFVKAYTAVEIDYFARRGKMSYVEVLTELKSRGLDLLPGGGAEIFAERVRRKICGKKIEADEWLEVHRVAHSLGIRSNCTMLYGHVEDEEDRVDHILRLRALADETGGFNSFIPLAYQDDHNPLARLVQDRETDGITDLKVYAASRLLFDNVPHLKGYWTTVGLRFAQVALSFGVDDLGGTAYNEKIMHDAGVETPVSHTQEELVRTIRTNGFEPCEVVSSYDKIFR
jgi:aminodeoxyfutalosine synthase